MPKAKFNIRSWARPLFSIVVMALVFTQIDFSSFTEPILRANVWWLVVGLLMILMETIVVAITWRAMLKTKGHNPPFKDMLHIMLVSNFLGFILPSSMGSDVMKVVGLAKYIGDTAEALSSLLLFRVIGYVALFFIAFISATLFSDYLPDITMIKTVSALLITFFFVLILAFVFMTPALGLAKWVLFRFGFTALFEKLKKLHDVFFSYAKNRTTMIKAFLGAMFMQTDRIVYVYVIALALGIKVEPVTLCLFVPLITALTTLPVSVSGIGVREGGYVFLFGYVGLNAGQALSLSLCGFALDIVFVLLGGVVYLFLGYPTANSLKDVANVTKFE